MDKLPNIHPGEILLEEFLRPMGISQYRLAKDIGIPQTRVSQIVRHKRSVSVDTALRLSAYFGTSARFWLNLQMAFDLENIGQHLKDELPKIPAVPRPAQ